MIIEGLMTMTEVTGLYDLRASLYVGTWRSLRGPRTSEGRDEVRRKVLHAITSYGLRVTRIVVRWDGTLTVEVGSGRRRER